MLVDHMRSNRKVAVFVLAAFSAFVLPVGLAAEAPASAPGSGTLSGFIFAKDMRSPVEGAVVKIRNVADAKEMESLPTDANGIYTIKDIPEGRYILGVSSAKVDFNLDYTLFVKAGELGKLSVSLVPGGGQEAGSTTPKKKGFFNTLAGRIVVVAAIGVGLYFLIDGPGPSPNK
jgi:hypothetical protein